MSAVSLSDIARNLNLSRMTVSMVINGKADQLRISEATRKRVLAEAERLCYRKNAHARAMITGKTRLIAYLERSIDREPSARTLQGVAEAALDEGYSVKPFIYENDDNFERVLYRAMEHRAEALMYRMNSHAELALVRRECRNFHIPLLVHGSAFPMEWGLRINTDDVHGGRMAVEHLIRLGHRKIAFVGSPGEGIEFIDSRYRGYLEALAAAGIETSKDDVLNLFIDKYLEAALKPVLALPDRPTALFCSTDYLAMTALRIIRRYGLSVPDDVSVVGYAGMSMGNYADPPLTTVAEPFEEVGRKAFKMMQSEIENEKPESMEREIHAIVDVKLIIRESTQKIKFN